MHKLRRVNIEDGEKIYEQLKELADLLKAKSVHIDLSIASVTSFSSGNRPVLSFE